MKTDGYCFPKLKDLAVNVDGDTDYGEWKKFIEEVKMVSNEIFKKKMIIEIEAKNEDLLKNEFNFIKAFLERNRDALHCKYKVKEID